MPPPHWLILPAPEDQDAPTYPPRRAVAGWVMFDWAAQPFFTLVTTFVFAPYFVAAIARDPVSGQALWGYATGIGGVIIALMSPVLGAIADRAGARKPWIAVFGMMLILGCSLLWYAAPGFPSAIAIALIGYGIALIGAEFAAVFNNAMMPSLVPPNRIGRLSGLGWASGYLGGLVSLILVLGFLASNPVTGQTLLGAPPLFGLDPTTREGDRITGPLSALWFIVFALPMFLLTPDRPRQMRLRAAVSAGLAQLRVTLLGLRQRREMGLFLLANMVYSDALVALFAFGGVYAAAAFGWGTIQIGIFGILLTVAGVFGALAGGWLDDKLGSRTVVALSLGTLIVTCLAIMGTTRETALYVFAVAPPVPGGPLFGATSERVYIGLGLLIGLVAGPLQAASRALLIRLCPPAEIGAHFGLFALSGKVTSFMGPLLVAIITQMTGQIQAGLAVLAVLFSLGYTVLWLSARPAPAPRP